MNAHHQVESGNGSPGKTPNRYDTVIVGGGHNGLAAAAYLSRAGQSVLLLEKLDVLGGAAVSTRSFEGLEANLSRYSYLVSLLPAKVITDLGLNISLARRRYSSYTPNPAAPTRGLLVDNETPRQPPSRSQPSAPPRAKRRPSPRSTPIAAGSPRCCGRASPNP